MRAIRRRGLAICMAALLMLSGFTVSAEPLQTENEDAVENVEAVSAISVAMDEEWPGETDDIEKENLPEVAETLAEDQVMVYAAGDIASGRDGNITWVIDASGKLTVNGTGDLDSFKFKEESVQSVPWLAYGSDITSAEINVAGMTNASYLFAGCSNMTSVNIDNFDTSNVTNMVYVFSGCSGLTSLDVSNFDTSSVTDMRGMFSDCSSLISLDVNNFDTSSVTDMSWMFSDCSSLTSLDVSNFNTSSVINMSSMFSDCMRLTSLDVSNFDTSSVIDMSSMFYLCRRLTSLDVSNFDTSSVKNMIGMFGDCMRLTNLDASNFDTRNVTNMAAMFWGCSSLTSLDVSGFNTSNVTTMEDMFSGCNSLTTINSPYNVVTTVLLPSVPGTAWYLPDGTEVTELPRNLSYSVTLTRSGASVTPAPTPTPTPVNPPSDDTIQKVQDFVSRMYTVALGRNAEEAGLNYWTNRLLTHEVDGAGIAYGFIMSDEFQNRNLSDGEFVDVLYRTFFNREAEEEGRSFWLSKLASGRTRGYVLSGFVNSVEFDDLCDSFGIARGTMKEDGNPYNPGIRQFVERQYTKVLNRQGERDGINYWMEEIISGRHMAEDVAKMFFQSEEFCNRNLNDADYVETLYETFLGRASETDGKNYWLQQINNGMNRNTVLEGFSRSEEFAGILRSFGL